MYSSFWGFWPVTFSKKKVIKAVSIVLKTVKKIDDE